MIKELRTEKLKNEKCYKRIKKRIKKEKIKKEIIEL